jgi:type IV pilus assembly protein PilV
MRKEQSGIMLLEALIAILIFSLGILGVIGMQASAVAASRDAKYRTDAGLLANELVGQMMSGNRDGTTLQANFQGDGEQADATNVLADGPLYAAWLLRVDATLPGVLANPPQVSVVPGVVGPPQTGSVATIVVRWLAPNSAVAHSHRVVVPII